MTKYNTGNSVGSADPRDLHDNATVADRLVNGDADFYPDRLGVNRRSWASVQGEAEAFFESSGYEFAGDYAAGIELTRYSQVVRDTAGEFWRLSGSTTLPYTTTGAGLPEGGAFVTVGDAALRQELAGDPASGQGAALVGGATIYVGSVAELLDIADPVDGQAFDVTGYQQGTDVGGGEFYWDAARPKADHNGGTVIDPVRPYPADWSSRTQITDWLTAGTAGTGCYVRRVKDKSVSVWDFGASGGGVLPDVEQFAKATDYVESVGGTLRVPRGEYAAKLHIGIGGIRIIGEEGTLIRAFDNDQLFRVLDTATDVYAEHIALNGQNAAMIGTRDTRATYGFDIRGRNVELKHIHSEAFRVDSCYIRSVPFANIRIDGFYFGDTSRNTVSCVQGTHIYFSNGIIYNKGDYDSTIAAGGLYLYDIEKNPGNPEVKHVYHYNVSFLSDNTKAQTSQVQIIDLDADPTLMHVYFEKCKFGIGHIGSQNTSIRMKNASTSEVVRGVYVDDCQFAGRVITSASTDVPIRGENCRFKNITMTGGNFSSSWSVGPFTELDNIKTEEATLSIAGAGGANVWRRDVQSYSDTIFTDQYVEKDPNRKVSNNFFNITNTTDYTDVVQLGIRTSYKITVACGDASAGQGGAIVETAAVVTGDFCTNGAINSVINPASTGVDVQWKNSSGLAVSSRTLQIRPRSAVYNEWVVTVEAIGRYSSSNGEVVWI